MVGNYIYEFVIHPEGILVDLHPLGKRCSPYYWFMEGDVQGKPNDSASMPQCVSVYK